MSNMNIFENAKFGDKFLTSDGRLVIYTRKAVDNLHYLVPEGSSFTYGYNDDGTLNSKVDVAFNIVSKIDEQPDGIDIVSRIDETHWHKTDDGDLPTESGNYWCKMKTKYEQGSSHYKQHCSDGYCILQWLNKKNQWNTRYTKQEDIIAWCELPKYDEE